MLHLPSYNAGLAAGTVAKALGQEPPETWDSVPGFEEIVCVRAKDRFFFPVSFAEGYWAAFEYADRQFSALPSDPDTTNRAFRQETAATQQLVADMERDGLL